MFFAPELLAKRDSGFGLLWLAATLGSKSAFKKLPKRSVLTADISQLCDQISQPTEPLALRLSSNLMFGVVRVYKVKQEIFLTDVTNCVTALKKVVQDLRSAGAQDEQLRMANPVARPSAVTLVPNPRTVHTLDYDAMVIDWDEYLNIGDATIGSIQISDDGDENFDPTQKKRKRGNAVKKDAPEAEVVRKETHTLDEHHEHVLSASYDLSFHGSTHEGPVDPSSSQVVGPTFDNFFPDALDNGDGFELELGDDLARELGWAVSPVKSVRGDDRHFDLNFDNFNAQVHDMDFAFDANEIPMHIDLVSGVPVTQAESTPSVRSAPQKQKTTRKENAVPLPGRRSTTPQIQALNPAASFSRQLLSQDVESFQPLRDITAEERNKENQAESAKKLKRTRLLLDARTELTDEELKTARTKYLQSQRHQRRELLQRRLEKDSGRVIEEMILGGPKGMQAQELVNFWQQNFKVQVETRTGIVRLHEEEDERSPRPKRRRIGPKNRSAIQEAPVLVGDEQAPIETNTDIYMDWGFDTQDNGMLVEDGAFRHSSEEPGQARRAPSRSGSIVGGNPGVELGNFDHSQRDSQRSSLFPWDNAGPSSSSGNDPAVNFDPAVEAVDVRLRSSSSVSRRGSSVAPSQRGSVLGGSTFSPAAGKGGSQIVGEDFGFEDNLPILEDTQQETQKSDLNLATLEKHSYNFLEYAKMQHRSLPRPDDRLSFEMVAPRSTSTRHVAAAAFYHCLVLATKGLVRLEQREPYVPVLIDII